jgi:Flp pilus assembly protein TadG
MVGATALIFALGALAVADFGSMLAARARAQAAADAAALAAIARQVPALGQGGDPSSAAREAAERNGAALLRCACAPGSSEAVVEVAVEVRIGFLGAWAGRSARASARAEVDRDVLTYR